jgi:hypothetical protein
MEGTKGRVGQHGTATLLWWRQSQHSEACFRRSPAMRRNVHILGIDHEIQTSEGRRSADEKVEFDKLLRALVSEHQIEFIGDETYPDKNAIAQSVFFLM